MKNGKHLITSDHSNDLKCLIRTGPYPHYLPLKQVSGRRTFPVLIKLRTNVQIATCAILTFRLIRLHTILLLDNELLFNIFMLLTHSLLEILPKNAF